ncbi:MAG: cupin domain-containing protein [Gracilibacteraceae bacterium]|nr:cupin domain-containing protein [Gracilibacteraceae bacterium]
MYKQSEEQPAVEQLNYEPPCYEPPCCEPPGYEPPCYDPCFEPPCYNPEPYCHEHHVYPPNPPYDPCNPNTYACSVNMMDYGPNPFNVDIYQATLQNNTFRTALWTGCHLQMTLMCIPVCEEIGLEAHPDTDQFLCVAGGQGLVLMGDNKDHLGCRQLIGCNCGIFVPAGTWHNIINTGNVPLKLYSLYAPPHHPWGTVHTTRAEAEAAGD